MPYIIRMSLSFRLGMILLGLGILLLGLYTQGKSIQGFQDVPAAPAAPAPPPAAMMAAPPATNSGTMPPSVPPVQVAPPSLTVSSTPPPTTVSSPVPVDEIQALKSKDIEIRNKFNMITKHKATSDSTLQTLISPDSTSKLTLLYNEVDNYVSRMPNFISTFSSATVNNQVILRQLLYTVSDQVNILYNIYFTIPSILISTDTIVKSDTATSDTVTNPAVTSESVIQMEQILSQIPSAESKLASSFNAVTSKILTITPDNSISEFNTTLQIYLNVLDAVSATKNMNVSETNKMFLNRLNTDSLAASKIQSAITANISFITSTISSLESIITSLQKNTNIAIPGIVSSLKERVKTFQESLAAMSKQIGTVTMMESAAVGSGAMGSGPMGSGIEGFISIGNPYDKPSPSLKQAREFSMGKRAYIDEVFAGIKFW